jgi:raffinose/stachyose/melibiose transport system substrate-binding protein
MKKRRITALLAVLALTAVGCGSDDEGGTSGAVEGEITVLTQRTDIVDTVFQDYKKRFEATYPDVTVKFEALTSYEDEVRIRMNSEDYGDVLLIPASVRPDQLPSFFEPLGTVEELGRTYRFIDESTAYEGKAYGIAITGNAQGFVYNKKIWRQAGLTTPPKTPAEFLTALQAIKDRTGAIPLYTNYKDAWALTQWEGARGGVSGDPEAVNKLADDDEPWAPGKEHHAIDSLLFDVVERGLVEPDPTTTNWEASKQQLADGKIALMYLGSWALGQIRQLAADPADVGYLPFPTQVDGKFQSVTLGDYKNGINIHSEHKAAAKAWIEWFTNESGYSQSEGGVPTVRSQPFPKTLADLEAVGTEFFELAPQPAGKEGLVNRIDDAAEIGLLDFTYRQRIVDAARGASKESKEQIFADLNSRWAEARAETE